jgi:hypothetical protein
MSETKLIHHILLQAIYDVVMSILTNNKSELQRLKEWFNSDLNEPFSFLFICNVLELNSKIIKNKIMEHIKTSNIDKLNEIKNNLNEVFRKKG